MRTLVIAGRVYSLGIRIKGMASIANEDSVVSRGLPWPLLGVSSYYATKVTWRVDRVWRGSECQNQSRQRF